MVDDQYGVDAEKDDHTSDDSEYGSSIGRRSYLKLTGTAAASLAAVSTVGQASAATARHGISFDRVVNVVDDLGVDPSGGRVDNVIGQHAKGGTLLVFPEGEYQFAQTQSVSSNSGAIGFLGKGDVSFVPPQGINTSILNVSANKILLENIDVDQTAENTTTGFTVHSKNGFHVEDIEFVGRGMHKAHHTDNYISVSVSNPNATGTLKNFVVMKGSAWGHYRGATGIWVGSSHKGTVKIVDCHIEECGSDGIYASRTPGDVHVEGGIYRNNNVCGVRISGEGSYVDGAVMEVVPEKYTGPHTQEESSFNLRGVVVEQKTVAQSLVKPAGVEVRNCDITIKENPTSGAGIAAWSNGKTVTVKNTRIQVDNNSPAVRREGRRYQGKNPPTGNPRWVRMNNCVITGSGSGGAAVVATAADESEITNCYIKQTGSNRDGVQFVDSSSTLVQNSIIDVTGKAVVFNSSSGKTINVANSGSPPSADIGASQNKNSQDKSRSSNDQSGSFQQSDSDSSRETTTGSIEQKTDKERNSTPSKDRNQAKSTKPDNTTDSNNPTKHTRKTNGKSESNGSLPHKLVVKGGKPGTLVKYDFSVSGSLKSGKYADGSEAINGSSAHGAVNGSLDSFQFSGCISQFDIDGNADISFK